VPTDRFLVNLSIFLTSNPRILAAVSPIVHQTSLQEAKGRGMVEKVQQLLDKAPTGLENGRIVLSPTSQNIANAVSHQEASPVYNRGQRVRGKQVTYVCSSIK
jgi:hypothetical protein